MKIETSAHAFLDSLTSAAAVIPAHPVKPILSMVKIEAREDRVELIATDLEIGIRDRVQGVTVKEPGDLLLPFEQLMALFREASHDLPVTIASDGTVARVGYGRSRFKIYGADPGEFPEVPALDTEDLFEVSASRLRDMFRKTHFATARDNPYFALNGVNFHVMPRQLDVVATDGRRLALVSLKEGVEFRGEKAAVLTVKTVGALDRILSQVGDEPLRFHIGESRFMARTSRSTIMCKIVDGAFPNYLDIIPSNLPITIEVGREELLATVRRAAILAEDENHLVKFALTPGELSLRAAAPGLGESEVSMEVAYAGPQTFESSFNAQFIEDALKASQSEKIVVKLGTPEDFGRLELGEGYTYVIAPVQLTT